MFKVIYRDFLAKHPLKPVGILCMSCLYTGPNLPSSALLCQNQL